MSTGTGIEWTEATWNTVSGCTRASEGCDNCYAVKLSHRLGAMGQAKYAGLTVLNPRGERHFNGTVRTNPASLSEPLGWKKPRRIFVNSMSDTFHKDVPFEFIDQMFAVMALCPQHTFQVLTKRPERMAEYLALRNPSTGNGRGERVGGLAWSMAGNVNFMGAALHRTKVSFDWPLPNVWLGTSCENQQRADERIPHLLMCPASVRFLSCEPLLGAIDLRGHALTAALYKQVQKRYPCDETKVPGHLRYNGPPSVDWVIVGGESGPNARDLHAGWVESIVHQCKAAGAAVFVKQLGRWPAIDPLPVTGDIVHACCKAANGTEVAVTRDDEGTMVLNPDISGFWRSCTPAPDLLQHRRLSNAKGGDPAEWPESLRVREMPR